MKTLKMGMVGGGIGAFVGKVHRMGARMIGGIDVAAGCFNRDRAQNDEIAARLRTAGISANIIHRELESRK